MERRSGAIGEYRSGISLRSMRATRKQKPGGTTAGLLNDTPPMSAGAGV
jgi:hypothetical protein